MAITLNPNPSDSSSAMNRGRPGTSATALAMRQKVSEKKTRIRGFPNKELIKFCRGMASMLKAQINTSDALKYYSFDHPNAEVRKTLTAVREQIDSGVPAFAAFAKTKRFDDKTVGLIRAGSESGQLHRAFAAMSHRLKKEMEYKAKLKKATLLPGMIICILIGLFIGAQLKVVPQVEGILDDIGQEPDPFSKFMFTVSHVTQKVWPAVVLLIGGGVTMFFVSEKARNQMLYLLMSRWRLLKNLIMGMRQMMFLGTLNMLHSNGINLTKAVETAAETVKGTPLFSELIEAGKKYKHTGLPFSEAMKKFTSCDPQVSHMISIGERSSSLENQLELLTTMYEEDVEQLMGDFTAAINFFALVLACVLICCVFIGAFLPIFLMGPKMMQGSGI